MRAKSYRGMGSIEAMEQRSISAKKDTRPPIANGTGKPPPINEQGKAATARYFSETSTVKVARG
jgi:IMP dehydrogenase